MLTLYGSIQMVTLEFVIVVLFYPHSVSIVVYSLISEIKSRIPLKGTVTLLVITQNSCYHKNFNHPTVCAVFLGIGSLCEQGVNVRGHDENLANTVVKSSN